MIARVCYIPYGTVLFRGEVDDAVHPPSFFALPASYLRRVLSAGICLLRNLFSIIGFMKEKLS